MSSAAPVVRVGVAAVVVNEDGLVLVGVRKGSLGATKLATPGGHLDLGEPSFSHCASRELHEETGLTIAPGDFHFGAVTNDVFSETKHYVTVFVVARYKEEHGRPLLKEQDKCEEWVWMDWGVIKGQEGRLFLPMQNVIAMGWDPKRAIEAAEGKRA